MKRPAARSTCMRSGLPGCRVRGERNRIAVSLIATAIMSLMCACGTSAGATSSESNGTSAVAASCAGLSAREEFTAAKLVSDGTMLPGSTVQEGQRRVLSSPARVRVSRYLKGRGPRVVRVQTGSTHTGSGVTVSGEGIQPVAGQRWRIYADRSSQPLTTSVCSGSRRLPGTRPIIRRFSAGGLQFDYPAAWHALRPRFASTFENPLVDLSPQVLHQPCVRHRQRSTTTIACRQPLARLSPGSLLATWTADAMPGFRFNKQPGKAVRVGGRPARLTVSHSSCRIAADLRMDLLIAVPGRDDAWDQFTACIRGPDTSRSRARVWQLLHSVRFTA